MFVLSINRDITYLLTIMVARATGAVNCVELVNTLIQKRFTLQTVDHHINATITGFGLWL